MIVKKGAHGYHGFLENYNKGLNDKTGMIYGSPLRPSDTSPRCIADIWVHLCQPNASGGGKCH